MTCDLLRCESPGCTRCATRPGCDLCGGYYCSDHDVPFDHWCKGPDTMYKLLHRFAEWSEPDMSGRVVSRGGGCKLCGRSRASHKEAT